MCVWWKTVLRTITENLHSYKKNPLSDSVPYISFEGNDGLVTYELKDFNSSRKAETSIKNFNYDRWSSDFETTKTIFAWIKPIGPIIGEQKIFTFSKNQASNFKYILSVNTLGQLCFRDEYNNSIFKTNNTVDFNEWNLIGLKIDCELICDIDNPNKNIKHISLVLNDEQNTYSYDDIRLFDEIKYLIIGSASVFHGLEELKHLAEAGSTISGNYYPQEMKFILAYASIGSSDLSLNDFTNIYSNGTKYLNNEPNYGASGVAYFNSNIYDDYDVMIINIYEKD